MPTEEERAEAYREQEARRKAFMRSTIWPRLLGNQSLAKGLWDRTKAARRDEYSWKPPEEA